MFADAAVIDETLEKDQCQERQEETNANRTCENETEKGDMIYYKKAKTPPKLFRCPLITVPIFVSRADFAPLK